MIDYTSNKEMFYGESIKELKVIYHIECSLYRGIHYNESLLHNVVVILNSFEILSINLGNKQAINLKVWTLRN
jgi:hypothetical protein